MNLYLWVCDARVNEAAASTPHQAAGEHRVTHLHGTSRVSLLIALLRSMLLPLTVMSMVTVWLADEFVQLAFPQRANRAPKTVLINATETPSSGT